MGGTANQAARIKGLKGDRSEAPSRTFERWADLACRALAKPGAGERAALEARYRRLADASAKARVQVSAEYLLLVVDELTGG